jgi:hypothetical protein
MLGIGRGSGAFSSAVADTGLAVAITSGVHSERPTVAGAGEAAVSAQDDRLIVEGLVGLGRLGVGSTTGMVSMRDV